MVFLLCTEAQVAGAGGVAVKVEVCRKGTYRGCAWRVRNA